MNKVLDPKSQFLDGPNSRGKELTFSLKVMLQLLKGFRKLHFVGPCITFFGSARTPKDHIYYQKTSELSRELSKLGFTIMTGGGPGIMEAANRGAFERGGKSVGCAIRLPREQDVNQYMHKWIVFDFFFVRKVLLLKYSYAFVVMPGGFGTLDELFETITLIQTAILHHFPVVVMGSEYYSDIQSMILKMEREQTISPEDKQLVLFTDSTDEAVNHIKVYIAENYKVKYKRKAFWLLGEKRLQTNQN
ncbi:LOG family protein [Portibacter marinus]|uniref:LOG family protein n=1 Tax=Portibacter marinus TaxID=2898660 RepID=UPI001F33FADD|nr:TIGR00730 family Rossman fold protein [Portibacter marinus]